MSTVHTQSDKRPKHISETEIMELQNLFDTTGQGLY